MKSALELKNAVQSPGFTPSVRDAAALVVLVGDADDTVRSAVERALARLGEALVAVVRDRWDEAPPLARVHLVRALARATLEGEAVTLFLRALDDGSPHVRRSAARALSKLRGEPAERAEQALVAAWERGGLSLEEQRAFASALGNLGAASAAPLLAKIETEDPELGRIAARARLMIERTQVREQGGTIDASIAASEPVSIVFSVRRGLEPVLEDELQEHGSPFDPMQTSTAGWVRGSLSGPLEQAWIARTALSFALRIERPGGSVAEALASEEAQRIFTTWTRGPIRYRLAFAEGGHRRAQVWQIAREVSERCPALINDPTSSLWEVLVHEPGANGEILLDITPRGLPDPRFAYRVRDVPAASHPTIAASLARVGGVREGDVVWDPFVGSGMELIERARLGACTCFGTDIAPKALDAARKNLESAGVTATLAVGDATKYTPPQPVTLIVTNPPMGLRVARTKELGAMLEQFLVHACQDVLAPGGRLVWLTAFPERTRTLLRSLPVDLELSRAVDMGGFWATLEILTKKKPSVVVPKPRERRHR